MERFDRPDFVPMAATLQSTYQLITIATAYVADMARIRDVPEYRDPQAVVVYIQRANAFHEHQGTGFL